MRKWRGVAALCALPLGFAWLCTGGCVEYSYWRWLPADPYNRDFRPCLRADVDSPKAISGVPLVYQRLTDRPPFGLRLTYITHTIVRDPTITFDLLAIEFPDGTVNDLTERFRAGVVPHGVEPHYSDDGKDQKRPSLRWELAIKDLVPQPTSFRLRVKGQLRSSGTAMEDFDAVLAISLRYESGSVTGWHWFVSDSC